MIARAGIVRTTDALVSAWAFLRRGQIVREPTPKVNVGSGLVVAPGWVNIDISLVTLTSACPRVLQRLAYRLMPSSSAARRDYTFEELRELLAANRFIHHRIQNGLPFESETVEFIYTSHFVEHLYLSEARRFFAEAYRVLKPGGIFRVCVPDLEHAIALYCAGRKAESLEYFFYDAGPSFFTRHRYMYDFEVLRLNLEMAGFAAVVRRGFKEGLVPDIDLLDNRPEETLFVEASKSHPASLNPLETRL
jgi:SAM-dependent methyltransferase